MNVNSILKNESELITEIRNWNIKFPFDLTWRRKYKIPFGCTQHRSMCLFDIKFDLEEDKMIEKIIVEAKIEKKNKELGIHDKQLLKVNKSSDLDKEKIDELFNDLDLDNLENLVI
jgi:hypothetical protein